MPAKQQGQYTDADLMPPTPPQIDTAAPEQTTGQRVLAGAEDVGKGILEGAGSTLTSLGSLAYPHWLERRLTGKDSSASEQALFAPKNTTQAVGKGLEQAGEFLLPGAAEEREIAKAAELSPMLGKAARIAVPALSSGLVNKAQGGSFARGAGAGAGGSVLGAGLKAVASPLAESALRVRGNQRLFGRTVGDAILNDTGLAVRPSAIARNAGAKIAQLTPELDAADRASAARGEVGSLASARGKVASIIGGHEANRAVNTANEVQPIAHFLSTDALTGRPLAVNQTAPGLRALKRGLNEDYIGKWSLDQPAAQKGAARQAYGALNDELHRISPETQRLDQRIASLIPVRLQGERVASEAPTAQRIMGRLGAHTGALLGASAGAGMGYREGGVPGAIGGGISGLVVPELLASPTFQMGGARLLNAAGSMRFPAAAALQAERLRRELPTDTGDQPQ